MAKVRISNLKLDTNISRPAVRFDTIQSVLVYTNPIKQINKEDRAPNVLDRAPDDHESMKLTDIVDDFCEEGVLEEIEEHLKDKGMFTAYAYEDYA